MESACEKGTEETGKQGGCKHRLWLLKLILRLCFAGRVRSAVGGRRESRGSDAPARCGRDSPCVQQQGQRPNGVCGESPKGPGEQPSPAALKGALARISSVRPWSGLPLGQEDTEICSSNGGRRITGLAAEEQRWDESIFGCTVNAENVSRELRPLEGWKSHDEDEEKLQLFIFCNSFGHESSHKMNIYCTLRVF